jgi:hypothetical protein
MVICKGIVKDNIVVLEEGVRLPDGAEVEIRLMEHSLPHNQAFAQVLKNRITRYIGMQEIIEDDKEEHEGHPDTWLKKRRGQ